MTARIRERVETPTSSKANTLDNTRLIRVNWVVFRAIPGIRDVLDQKDWDTLEGMAAEMPNKRVFRSDLNSVGEGGSL